MAHGDHWAALLGDDKNNIVDIIETVLSEGTPTSVTDEQKQYQASHPTENTYLGIEYGDVPVVGLAVLEKNPEKETYRFTTAYPYLRDGVPNVLEITDIRTLPQVCETTVTGVSRAGGVLSFFEPLYFKNRFILRTGGKYEFSLAAIAYGLEKMVETELTISRGPFLAMERERALRENPDADVNTIGSVKIDVSQLGTLVFMDDDFPEDAQFQTVVEDVDYFRFDGIEICRMPVELKMGGNRNFRINLYASEHVLKSYKPQTGDTIRGMLWMQGYAVKEVDDPESWAVRGRETPAYETILKAIEAEEYLSDLPSGVQAVGLTLIHNRMKITRYAHYGEQPDVPAYLAEYRGEEINVWVRSYIENEEPELFFSEEERRHYAAASEDQGQKGICIVVVCKDIGSGYTFTYHGLEQIEEITGRKPASHGYRPKRNIH